MGVLLLKLQNFKKVKLSFGHPVYNRHEVTLHEGRRDRRGRKHKFLPKMLVITVRALVLSGNDYANSVLFGASETGLKRPATLPE